MTSKFYHKCAIKNLSPEGPSNLTSIEEMLLFSKVAAAMQRRKWKMEWLAVDLEKCVLNIDHDSITEDQALAFYDEVFSGIGKEVLDFDEEGKKLLEELTALSSSGEEKNK